MATNYASGDGKETNRLWRKYKELKATIQTCSNENCRAQYVASSPEYPCPWCIIVEKDAKIQQLQNEKI